MRSKKKKELRIGTHNIYKCFVRIQLQALSLHDYYFVLFFSFVYIYYIPPMYIYYKDPTRKIYAKEEPS